MKKRRTYKRSKLLDLAEYRIWAAAKTRCFNRKQPSFKWYGAKGITMCKEWVDSFSSFFAYVGPRPSPHHSLDRYPNQNGNYEPGNVRWATPREQGRNTSRNRILLFDGKEECIATFVGDIGGVYQTYHSRLSRGWTPEESFTTPLRTARKIEYKGRSLTAKQWSAITGIRDAVISSRAQKGWTAAQIIETPSFPGVKRKQ